jgi:hypothetical protein
MSDVKSASNSLQDIEDIRVLKHTYGALADACASPDGARFGDDIAALFVEDGVWAAPDEFGGRHAGRAAIKAFFATLGQSAIFASHLMLNDRIKVSGDCATGTWKNIIPVTYLVEGKPTAFWIFGGYRDEYVKVDGRWFFRQLNAYVDRSALHDKGWA